MPNYLVQFFLRFIFLLRCYTKNKVNASIYKKKVNYYLHYLQETRNINTNVKKTLPLVQWFGADKFILCIGFFLLFLGSAKDMTEFSKLDK